MNDELPGTKPPAPPPPPPAKPTGLALLRAPIPDHLISPLPKPTKAQTDAPNEEKFQCPICNSWHHRRVVHLDYVGHATATSLLLEADEHWNWEPLAFDPDGLPLYDRTGGLWIKLTVCGVTRLGYGNANPKGDRADSGARDKEVIGDAIRNAAMRFGLALQLWSKVDLHIDPPDDVPETRDRSDTQDQPVTQPARTTPVRRSAAAAPATKPAAKTLPAGKPAETVGVISIGQVNNIKNKIRALGLEPDMVEAMCKRLGVPVTLEKIPLARFKDVQKELDRVRDA